MEYSYDVFGWLSDTIIPDRITDIAPPEGIEKIDGQPYPNFTGYDWVMLRYPNPEPTPPPVPPTPDPITILTPYEFLKRFTSEERKAIKAATLTNPDVDDLWTMFTVAQDIDLRNTDTINGVDALESLGILAEGRAAEILA
jgi:hypothetical protein